MDFPYTCEFMEPRLVGDRFNEHTIPFELLKNLAVLENLIIEAAKWEYLIDHPNRQRVPRGFTEGVSLQLKQVNSGSTQIDTLNLDGRMFGFGY